MYVIHFNEHQEIYSGIKNGFFVSQHLEIFKELSKYIKNIQISMIRVIFQVKRQMESMEPELVKGSDTSKLGTTFLTAGCLSPGARSQYPELGTKFVYIEHGRMRCLTMAI